MTGTVRLDSAAFLLLRCKWDTAAVNAVLHRVHLIMLHNCYIILIIIYSFYIAIADKLCYTYADRLVV